MKVAFIGKPGAGKDTCAEILKEIYGGTIIKFATPVCDICKAVQLAAGKPVVKDRQLLRMIGEGVKHVYGHDVWVNIAASAINNTSGNIFVSDLRFKNELSMLLDKGFTTIRILRDTATDNYYTEINLDEYDADYTIQNTDIDLLRDSLIKNLN